ncbi:hypothetical protein HMPREF2826_08855 [Olsenella sp. HMSC062G07]|nr:hypothetical protein HMPREF2826_08855 [Olsenella sp. HMSC062G07]
MMAATTATLAPQTARADTASDLARTESDLRDAQAELDAVQARLDELAAEYQDLARAQSDTLAQVESTQGQIDDTQAQIDARQRELDEKRRRLAQRVSSSYKSDDGNILSVLMSSTSLEDLASNVYYFGKISENDRRMIQEVKDVRAQLDQQKAELEDQKTRLEELSQTQRERMQEMRSRQDEVRSTLDGMSDQVKQLLSQRDDQLQQMAEQRAAQERAAREAAAARARASSAASAPSGVTGALDPSAAASGAAARVVDACHATPSPGGGYCAMWVSMVFQNAGLGYPAGDACDMYDNWCVSSDRGTLRPGMIVAVSTHSHTSAGRIYGHIGIYVGGGTMMDNIGYIRTIGLNEWVSYYGTSVTPRWGWVFGRALG